MPAEIALWWTPLRRRITALTIALTMLVAALLLANSILVALTAIIVVRMIWFLFLAFPAPRRI